MPRLGISALLPTRLNARPVDGVEVEMARRRSCRAPPRSCATVRPAVRRSSTRTPSLRPDMPTSRFVRAPGTWPRKALSPSRVVGRTSSCSCVSSVRVAVDVVSTSGEAPETVIVSAHGPQVHHLVDSRHEPHRQPHALPSEILKSGQLIDDRIGADRQRASVGSRLARL